MNLGSHRVKGDGRGEDWDDDEPTVFGGQRVSDRDGLVRALYRIQEARSRKEIRRIASEAVRLYGEGAGFFADPTPTAPLIKEA